MSDNKEQTLPSVTRNGISLELSRAVFGKTSDNPGKEFFTPEMVMPDQIKVDYNGQTCVPALVNIDSLLWLGLDQLLTMTNKGLRTVFGAIAVDNLKENGGTLNLESFLEEAKDFTAARQSLADINEQLEDLQALQQSYATDPDFGATVDGSPDGQKTERGLQLETLMKATAAKIRPLRIKREAIQKEYEERAAKRAATKAANEAKAAASKLQPQEA